MMSERRKMGRRTDSVNWGPEGEPIEEVPRRVRQKGPPRYAPNLNPGPGIDLDYEPFSKAEVEALIRAVNYPLVKGLAPDEVDDIVAVQDALNLQARSYRFSVELDRQPTPSTLIKEIKGLERSASELAARLPLLTVLGDPNGREFAAAPAHGILWPLRNHLPAAMEKRTEQRRKETIRTVQRKGVQIKEENTTITKEAIFGASTAEDLVRILSEAARALAAACAAAVSEIEQRSVASAPSEHATALRHTVRDLLRIYADLFGRKPIISKEGTTNRPSGPALRFVQGALLVMGVETSDDNILRIYRQESKSSKSGD